MSVLVQGKKGETHLLMGNEAIVRGALEAGVSVAAGYPGTPSSEVIENLSRVAKDRNMYVEWSVNEKVAAEVAAAGSLAGLRSLCTMKMNGVHVASDFLLHLALSGTRGGMVLLACDDPNAHSSQHEGEMRNFSRMLEIPLLEPGNFQDAKDVMKWAYELSEQINSIILVRSTTRLSHASGQVVFGELPENGKKAEFRYDGFILDQMTGTVMSLPIFIKHPLLQEKLLKASQLFEDCPFNTYTGPENPEILIIASSACSLYSLEAIRLLGLQEKAGLLKLVTTWPLPKKLIQTHLQKSNKVLVVEEVLPFMEENLKVLAYELAGDIGVRPILGKRDGTLPMHGEMNPDLVVGALSKITGIPYAARPESYTKRIGEVVFFGAPARDLTFCPGCPHRASLWSIENVLQMDHRKGFVCGDVGCYTMGLSPNNFGTLKTAHSMGSGTGLAGGFGKLVQFGMDQPVLSLCGDSTFFHAAMPALVNAVHHQSNMTMVILDNSGTAMTGFQPHPGIEKNAMGDVAQTIDIPKICEAIGARVKISDPFDVEKTQEILFGLLEEKGPKVLILKQMCALSPEKKHSKKYEMTVNTDQCLGENCGCNRLCTRIFRCPGLVWDKESKTARIDEILCTGCGVCASICPANAISKKEPEEKTLKEAAI
jgi:indolepyruvate ferredoxin oxidoreductase alpha subunit